MLNQTKIIATLGPATANEAGIRSLIRAGASCLRLNFSHGGGDAFQPLVDLIRQVSREEGVWLPILADIQGPKLRIGKIPAPGVELTEGQTFTLTAQEIEGSQDAVQSQYELLAKDVAPGTHILLADGAIELCVKRVDGEDVVCEVTRGGPLSSNKGLNIPDTKLSVDTLTPKDKLDLEYVAQAGLDMVAISFVRSAWDLRLARYILGTAKIPIMAKLELPETIKKLDEILNECDGIMVARGDLAVEMPFEQVPLCQKEVLKRAAKRGKWAVVATQMLRSMVENHRPSRAEVSDVFNAVIDGADALMLSEETAVGKYPIETIEAMAKIAHEATRAADSPTLELEDDVQSFSAGAAGAAVSAASRVNAKAIVALAGSGLTALLVSKWHPEIPVLALSAKDQTLRRLNVLRGVRPVQLNEKMGMEEQIQCADEFIKARDWGQDGDTVVVVAATPLGQTKETNTIRFHHIGSVS